MPDEATQEKELITLKTFFESVPPGNTVNIKNIAHKNHRTHGGYYYQMNLPELHLHCNTETCNGIRFFEPQDTEHLQPKKQSEHFVTYQCRNCKRTEKTYTFWAYLSDDETNGHVYKFGEHPSFGPPTPARVITLIGAERDYYLKGRRSENQGLGIAAFAYYRRVIENQKDKILNEIIRVSKKLGAEQEILDDLEKAKKETQFSKAVSEVKHGIPQTLLINGHNPLTLLHSALSEGLHAQTDEQCLELATSIRVVLTDLVERIANALKDEDELNTAINRLLQSKNGEQQ